VQLQKKYMQRIVEEQTAMVKDKDYLGKENGDKENTVASKEVYGSRGDSCNPECGTT
jgi:hypothetical protein